jgi:hypothetical protein
MWFTEPTANKIGRITVPAGIYPLVAAVLPSSRSVEVGTPATAFATIINASASDATGCAIALVTTVPAGFQYQTTNPATNQLIGTQHAGIDPRRRLTKLCLRLDAKRARGSDADAARI